MADFSTDNVNSLLEQYAAGFPELREEITAALAPGLTDIAGIVEPEALAEAGLAKGVFSELAAKRVVQREGIAADIASERIVLFGAGARPVMRIRDNRITGSFIGPKSASWAERIKASRELLNAAIPAVGRIELVNSEIAWAGTAWLIDESIIVTNRHVIELFARPDGTGRFVFKPGLNEGSISSDIDFQEDEDRADRNEHPIDEVLSVSDEDDVAFLRIREAAGKTPLPAPIPLAEEVKVDSWIAAIGFPARDPTIPDQALVREIFGDVYEKKRLAPGKVMSVDDVLLRHDCSTLGGNSGSVLIDLTTGRAVGLHYGGYLDDTANVAVPAPRLRVLLDQVKRPRFEAPRREVPPSPPAPMGTPGQPEAARILLNLPVEILVRVGTPTIGGAAGITVPTGTAPNLEAAVEAARAMLAGRPDVVTVRGGYRFRSGWITDEQAVVVTVHEKKPENELSTAARLPLEIFGFGVDVRTEPLAAQLANLGVDILIERPGRPGGYVEPPGYNDSSSGLELARVRENMRAVFHVSPDSGFPQLRDFFSRVQRRLTATMYEWNAKHVSDALERAMRPAGARLKMVTQKRGVGQSNATETAVLDMQRRIGRKFSHVYASVLGPNRLIPGSYHIKVASRDDEEFWLSSGNWKDSGQPNIDPAGTHETSDAPLNDYNREWHAVVAHAGLATLFRRYIDYDFAQARRYPLPEAPAFPEMEVFVPVDVLAAPEAPRRVRYFEPLLIEGEVDVQPLLTPDRNARGQRLFMAAATDLVEAAERSIYVQNQTFNYSGDDNAEMTRFVTVLRDKQRAGLDVRIIFRDAHDYKRLDDIQDQRELVERLKKFGFDTRQLKVQSNCHTKGIIVDSRFVILGSQNLSNGGALFNRDASLLVRSPVSVAQYFEQVFLYDWDNLAYYNADTPTQRVRSAPPGAPTPPGFRRVRVSALID